MAPLYNRIRHLDWEKALYITLFILALLTRLWNVGDRVQSHDESIHARYSWNLYAGYGFQHNPLMHGPLMFHVTALFYFLFGDNDFVARVPVALIGTVIVVFPYFLRRWLGRAGALAAVFFLLISPSIAYYSRYFRHDIPTILWSLGIVLALLSYLRDGRQRWLYLLAACVSLTFATKEVAFIYNAIFGFFLVLLFVTHTLESKWPNEKMRPWFLCALIATAVGLLIAGNAMLGAWIPNLIAQATQTLTTEPPRSPGVLSVVGLVLAAGGLAAAIPALLAGHLKRDNLKPSTLLLMLVAAILVLGAIFRLGLPFYIPSAQCAASVPPPQFQEGMTEEQWRILEAQHRAELDACIDQEIQNFQWPEGKSLLAGHTFINGGQGIMVDMGLLLNLLPIFSAAALVVIWMAIVAFRHYRAFDLTVLLGTLCLPFLAPLLIHLGNVDSIDYNMPAIAYSAAVAAQVLLLSVAIGLLWNHQRQMTHGYAYDWFIAAAIHYGIFVAFFTTFLTNGYGIASGLIGSLGYWLKQHDVERGGQPQYYYLIMVSLYEYLPLLLTLIGSFYLAVRGVLRWLRPKRTTAISSLGGHFLPFLLWWIVMSWLAYSIAGERMPWLTTHIALPMLLFSGWLMGRFLEWIDWQRAVRGRAWLLALATPLLIIALVLLGRAVRQGVFQGHDLAHLQTTGQFINGLVSLLLFGVIAYLAIRGSGWRISASIFLLVLLLLPVVLTVRTAWRFCYITDEYPTEFLVYAHGAPGVSEAMDQIREISSRVAGGPELIKIAYGSDGSTFWHWQLRNFPNAVFYGEQPSREQLDVPIVIAGWTEWSIVEPYLGDRYISYTYPYIWWPMQDYWYLNWERVRYAITNPDMRAALWDIWYDRDYTRYDALTNTRHSLDEWVLRNDFRLYIRRDIAALIWDAGTMPPPSEGVAPSETDLYGAGWRDVTARLVFGAPGSGNGQFQNPRGIAVGPDGSVYVADTGNQRIQKFTADGAFVAAWGHTCIMAQNEQGCQAPGGAGGFLDPWGVAVDSDGTIYVADTWNHRIQKLSAEGVPLVIWGKAGRHIVTDPAGQGAFYGPRDILVAEGRVYVSDTGNKRIQVFDPNGRFLFQWGGGGVLPGYLDEPVGLALGPDGNIYVADTWNRRVQVFDPYGHFIRQWPISGWDVGLVDEKPYLAVDAQGYVYVTDPAHYRVLVFDQVGNYVLSFGKQGGDAASFGFPQGIAIGMDGLIYVTDAQNNRVMVFDPVAIWGDLIRVAPPELNMPSSGDTLPAGPATLMGTAGPFSTVQVMVDGRILGATQASAAGVWSLVVELNEPGTHEIVVQAMGDDGRLLAASAPVAITVVAPVAPPTISYPPAEAELPAGPTTMTGTSEPGAVVEILDNGAVIGEATVNEEGAWRFTFDLVAGEHRLEARLKDWPEASVIVAVQVVAAPVGPGVR